MRVSEMSKCIGRAPIGAEGEKKNKSGMNLFRLGAGTNLDTTLSGALETSDENKVGQVKTVRPKAVRGPGINKGGVSVSIWDEEEPRTTDSLVEESVSRFQSERDWQTEEAKVEYSIPMKPTWGSCGHPPMISRRTV